MTTVAVKINVNNKIAVETTREGTRIPTEQLPAVELLTEAVEESGDDCNGTVTLVTPRNVFIYNIPNKFMSAVEETNMGASAEIVC